MMSTSAGLPSGKVRITFKNVGQGDTIILEWLVGDKLNIGIIDCTKSSGSTNVVVDYLKSLDQFTIRFIIFTHPHKDHYSGGVGLFEFLIDRNIRVGRLSHTFYFHSQYVKLLSGEDGNALTEFIQATQKVNKANGGAVGEGFKMDLNGTGLRLCCLSPADPELGSLRKYLEKEYEDGFKSNRSAFNSISAVFALVSDTRYVLLTADAPAEVFERLAKEPDEILEGKELYACQIPHHGSKLNHSEKFWTTVKKVLNCAATVSVGPNKYDHPSDEVLTFFHRKKYHVSYTNQVYGAKEFYHRLTTEEKRICLELDHISRELDLEARDIIQYFDY